MDRNPGPSGRLIEQLQNVQIRQRRIIQQLQAENARRLSDLTDVRQERDTFRKEVARVRRENAELQNKLEEVISQYQDLKRERATLARSVVAGTYMHGRNANPGFKILNTLSVLNEEQSESPPIAETTTAMEKAALPKLEPYLHRGLPDPPRSESPRPDHPVSTIVTARKNLKSVPRIQTSLSGAYSATS